MRTESSESLPVAFKDLEVFVPKWALAKESDRINARWTSTMDELRAFYSAMVPRLDAIIDYLNGFSIDALPASEKRLFHLTLSLAEIADAVETFGAPEVPYSFDPARYAPTEEAEES